MWKDSEVTRATGDIVADATMKVTGLKGRPDVDDDAAAAVDAPDVEEVAEGGRLHETVEGPHRSVLSLGEDASLLTGSS